MSPLYKVKLTWSVQVQSATSAEAHAKVVKMLKEAPEGFITGIESGGVTSKPRSIIGRIITGR